IKLLLRSQVFSHTRGFTLERSHISVSECDKAFTQKSHLINTRGFTLERSHISVLNVMKAFHISQVLSDTRGFTLE
ncbi:unnamed protein product, partial [Staurois parvus]